MKKAGNENLDMKNWNLSNFGFLRAPDCCKS